MRMKPLSAAAFMPGLIAITMALGCPAAAEPFTIRCARDGYYFLTFDTQARRVVYEAPSTHLQGPMYKGHITSTTESEILMEFLVGGRPPVPMIWDRVRWTLQHASDAAAGGAPSFFDCTRVELRPALAWFDKLYPHE